MPSQVETVIEAYRQRLAAREASQMALMAGRWMQVENSLAGRVAALTQQVEEMRAQGILITPAKLYRLEHYQALLAQAKIEMQRYAQWSAELITLQQRELALMGGEAAVAAIRAVYWDASVMGAYFNILPAGAINTLIGYAGDGTPLYKLLMRDYPESVIQLTQALIDGMAQGIGPRATAKTMLDAMAGNLNRALTIARSEQLRAYREANRQQMIESKVVEGYIRRCALNDRTCMACIVLDGTFYPTDELMEVHPNDRCFMQPKIIGLAPLDVLTGQSWFSQQTEELQRQMMGPGAFEAWQSGQIELGQLASTHVDPVWGPTVRITPLSELTQ